MSLQSYNLIFYSTLATGELKYLIPLGCEGEKGRTMVGELGDLLGTADLGEAN